MKIRILDRFAAALAGMTLFAGAAALAGSVLFGRSWIDTALALMRENTLITVFALAVLVLAGVLCFLILFRHVSRKKRYLVQSSEAGECHISLKALDEQVTKCLLEHPELDLSEVKLVNEKNSLSIHVIGNMAGGISIPQTVEVIQNEIREYIKNCSGVMIKDILFQVEETGADAANAPFLLHAPASIQPAANLTEAEEETAPIDTEEMEMHTPVQEDTSVSVPVPEDDMDDDRPLHQRIFAAKQEACIVPCPPLNEEAEPAVNVNNTEAIYDGDELLGEFDEENAELADPVTKIPFMDRGESAGEEM